MSQMSANEIGGTPAHLVRGVPAEGVLVDVPRQLDVRAPAVQLLLVLDRQLQHQVLAVVGKRLGKLGGQSVKSAQTTDAPKGRVCGGGGYKIFAFVVGVLMF